MRFRIFVLLDTPVQLQDLLVDVFHYAHAWYAYAVLGPCNAQTYLRQAPKMVVLIHQRGVYYSDWMLSLGSMLVSTSELSTPPSLHRHFHLLGRFAARWIWAPKLPCRSSVVKQRQCCPR